MSTEIRFDGMIGHCGDREVFIAFAQARVLARISFPDVLNEATGNGYQRRFSPEHSLEFKRYIHSPGATSSPLTFNLRCSEASRWSLHRSEGGRQATLVVTNDGQPVMAQVDGQHRLGFLQDSPVEFSFMSFIGLSVDEEMKIFRTINGKAKGLSSSLLDFTEARLVGLDLPLVKPELYIAVRLSQDPSSPWYQRLDFGGEKTVGMKRIASLRTMQVAAKRMLKSAKSGGGISPEEAFGAAMSFWRAVAFVLPVEWGNPRHHMLVKGIGVYALMSFAGLLIGEAKSVGRPPDFEFFVSKLSDFVDDIDWSNDGPLHGYGGASGADAALELILQVRSNIFRRLSVHA